MQWAGSAGKWTGAVASFAIMMTLLTAKLGFVETLRALRMTFAASQLPTERTLDALVAARPTAGVTAEVTLGAGATVAVVAISAGCATFAALQLQSFGAGGAIHA